MQRGDMKFGEYLKQRRSELGWTQPEAAAKAGIEQSYLSKLEAGKSMPSEEVYQRLADAFAIDLDHMVSAVASGELERLRDIEAIRTGLVQQQQHSKSATRRWLFAGLAMLILGGGFVGLAQTDRGGLAVHYIYQSSGVILPGESLDVFAGVDDEPDPAARDYAARIARRDALIARLDEQTKSVADMRGPTFSESVAEGMRLWSLVGASERPIPARYGWAFAPGLALIIGGLGCFFISWRRP